MIYSTGQSMHSSFLRPKLNKIELPIKLSKSISTNGKFINTLILIYRIRKRKETDIRIVNNNKLKREESSIFDEDIKSSRGCKL